MAVDDTISSFLLTTPGGGGDDPTGTSGAFDPPDNCLIVVEIGCDTNAGVTPTATVTGGTSLAWTERVSRGDSEGTAGIVKIYEAPVTSNGSMTVTVTVNNTGLIVAGGTDCGRAKVYIVTNPHATPIGNVGENSNTTNNWTATNLINVSASTSYVFAAASDWNALGTPEGSSNMTEENWDIASRISGIFAYVAPGASGNFSPNFNAAGSAAADWNAVALEIVVAAGGGATFNRIVPQLMMVGVGT